MVNVIDEKFITEVENRFFRTEDDSGANSNAMMIWNVVRGHVGLPRLEKNDLPAYCKTHDTYHVIRQEYGCARKEANG